MEREKLAERIAKLLRLANNNPSEREAVAAMERAYALMEEHNLTMAQVDAHGSGDERIEESAHGTTAVRPGRATSGPVSPN